MNYSFHFYFCFTEEKASVFQMKFSKALEFINGGGGILALGSLTTVCALLNLILCFPGKDVR